MPVIKQANSESAVRNAIVLDLGDLRRQGDAIVEQAQAEADRILVEAKAEAATLVAAADGKGHTEGRERGYAEGREAGEQAGRQEVIETLQTQFEALATSLSEALTSWQQQRDDLMRGAREDVLALALALARKIVLRVPAVEPTVVQDQLLAALELMNAPSSLTVRMHPDDRPLLQDVLPELLDQLAACGHAELVDDDSIARGGCTVRSGRGLVDATLETQLDRIAQMLLPEATAPRGEEQER